jgi:lysyl-tRNA synthetase class 2
MESGLIKRGMSPETPKTLKTSTAPSWRPDSFGRRRPMLEIRARVTKAARAFFDAEGFTEVDTPALQLSPGNEVHLHAFATEFIDPHAHERRAYYLHTSPEFAMKKLLVAGMPKIFQLAHAFRNGEWSARHHPEFIMLEWYRAGATLDAMRDDCVALVRAAATAAGIARFSLGEATSDPFAEWDNLTVVDAFTRYAGIDLASCLDDVEGLRRQMRGANLRATEEDQWDDLFFRVLGEKIEPHLGHGRPTFLRDYPVSMAALARPKRNDPRFAERFELYICGYEIANAFDELTDADEQERRFAADMDAKERLYGIRYPVDPDFIAALRHGMPDSAGIALGFDRLVMLCAGTREIEDTLWLPISK